MALSQSARAVLNKQKLPSREELIPIVNDYIAKTGLTRGQFASRIGYSLTTLCYWFNGQYTRVAGSDRQLRARVVSLMETHPIATETAYSGTLHETENVRQLRSDFYLALDRARIVVRHGNPGTQKSFVTEHLIAELNRSDAAKNGSGRRAYRIRCSVGIRPLILMRRIAVSCGVASGVSCDSIINNLRYEFSGRRVLLVFDEAQFLDVTCLELIRELNDEPPFFGLLLVGSHDLPEKFKGFSMEQWRSRLLLCASLPGIQPEEATDIVRKELPWMSQVDTKELLKLCNTKDELAQAKEAKVCGTGKPVNYINARDLFWNIEEIKKKDQARIRK